jgi:hypothetical protein
MGFSGDRGSECPYRSTRSGSIRTGGLSLLVLLAGRRSHERRGRCAEGLQRAPSVEHAFERIASSAVCRAPLGRTRFCWRWGRLLHIGGGPHRCIILTHMDHDCPVAREPRVILVQTPRGRVVLYECRELEAHADSLWELTVVVACRRATLVRRRLRHCSARVRRRGQRWSRAPSKDDQRCRMGVRCFDVHHGTARDAEQRSYSFVVCVGACWRGAAQPTRFQSVTRDVPPHGTANSQGEPIVALGGRLP